MKSILLDLKKNLARKSVLVKSKSSINIDSRYYRKNSDESFFYSRIKLKNHSAFKRKSSHIRQMIKEAKEKSLNDIENFYQKCLIEKYTKKDHFYITSKTEREKSISSNRTVNLSQNISSSDIHIDKINPLLDEEFFSKFKKEKMNFQIGKCFDFGKTASKICSTLREKVYLREILKEKSNSFLKKKEEFTQRKQKIEFLSDRLEKDKDILIGKHKRLIESYIFFLKKRCEEDRKKLELLKHTHERIKMEINKIIQIMNAKKKEFNKLKEGRNFLIKVKEVKLKLPSFFEEIEKGSSYQELNIPEEVYLRYKNYLNINIPIFSNEEEFFEIFARVQRKNLDLLRRNEKIKMEVQEMQSNYEIIKNDEENYENFINGQIRIKKKELQTLLMKYDQLSSQIKSLSFRIEEEHKKKSSKIASFKPNDITREMIIKMKYQKELKNYSFEYSLLHVKVANIIRVFLEENILTVNDVLGCKVFSNMEKLYEELYLKYNASNEEKIKSSLLNLLVYLEKGIISLFAKYRNAIKNPKKKEEIEKLIAFNQNLFKNENAKKQRIFIEKKRVLEMKKVVEKSNKIIVLPRRKVNVVYKNESIRRKEKKEKIQKIHAQSELEQYITLTNN